MRFLLPLFFVFSITCLGQQNKIDSLKKRLNVNLYDSVKFNLLINIANEYKANNIDSTLYYQKMAYKLNNKLNNLHSTAFIVFELSNTFYNASMPEENLKLNHKYYKIFKQKKYNYGMVTTAFHLSHTYQGLSQLDSALYYFDVGIKNADTTNFKLKNLKIKMLRSRAHTYLYRSKYPSAIKDLLYALTLVDSNEYENIASTRQILGQAYQDLNDKESALKQLQLALKAAKDGNSWIMEANTMIFLARLYGHNDEALSYAIKGLKIYEENKSEYGILFAKNTLSEIYLARNELEKAENELIYIITNGVKHNLIVNISAAKSSLGVIENKRKNYSKAKEYCSSAWNFYKNNSDFSVQSQTCKCLSVAFEGLHQNDSAIYYLKKSIIYNDSLHNTENIKKGYQIKNKYEIEKKEIELKEKQHAQELITEQKIQSKNYLIGGISIVAILVLATLFFAFKTKQKQQEAAVAVANEKTQEQFSQQLLQSQEDERVRISRELHDSVGQDLILLKNKAQLIKNNDLEKSITATLNNVREITQGLHPFVLEKFGLTTALNKLIENIDKNSELFITTEIENIDNLLSKNQELSLYRIAQEALNNILKHANSPSAVILAKKTEHHITLSIQDFGKGFNTADKEALKNNLGMKTLKERAKVLAATLDINSKNNEGTTLLLKIPIKA
mgnify:CR=1 FL=1